MNYSCEEVHDHPWSAQTNIKEVSWIIRSRCRLSKGLVENQAGGSGVSERKITRLRDLPSSLRGAVLIVLSLQLMFAIGHDDAEKIEIDFGFARLGKHFCFFFLDVMLDVFA
jgi:hypothetical protein